MELTTKDEVGETITHSDLFKAAIVTCSLRDGTFLYRRTGLFLEG